MGTPTQRALSTTATTTLEKLETPPKLIAQGVPEDLGERLLPNVTQHRAPPELVRVDAPARVDVENTLSGRIASALQLARLLQMCSYDIDCSR